MQEYNGKNLLAIYDAGNCGRFARQTLKILFTSAELSESILFGSPAYAKPGLDPIRMRIFEGKNSFFATMGDFRYQYIHSRCCVCSISDKPDSLGRVLQLCLATLVDSDAMRCAKKAQIWIETTTRDTRRWSTNLCKFSSLSSGWSRAESI